MIDFIDTSTGGHPSGPVSRDLLGSRDQIINTGLIPTTTISEDGIFREGTLANGIRFSVERMTDDDSLWDVWLGLPQDPWLEELATELRTEEILAMRARVWRQETGRDRDD